MPLGYRCIDKKLVVVPEEAEVVRAIFSWYLELGSVGALIAELDRQGIRTKFKWPSRWPQERRYPLRRGFPCPSAQEPVLH